jgi:AmmeMemoRadiSam system protein B
MSQTPAAAAFNPDFPHHWRPKLRPVRGFPTQVQGQTMLGLSDARQISERMVIAPMAAQSILPLMNGERSVGEIVAQTGRGLTDSMLKQFIAQLDSAGLLFGPTFDAMLAQMHKDFDSTPTLPPSSTAAMAEGLVGQKVGQEPTQEQKDQEGPAALREAMDQWVAKTLENDPNPAFSSLPKAIMAPHIDYPRGWMNYASVWGRMKGVERPDRIVILGTNHFGMGTGVTACDKGYQTPLGVSPADTKFLGILSSTLGDEAAQRLVANRYDHEREHSIELQVGWAQHAFGDGGGSQVPVVGILVHDPTVKDGASYDGKGLALKPFVDGLRAAIADAGGRTLIVSSADLSHVGPMFGDKEPLVGEQEPAVSSRNKVLQHDQEMLQLVAGNKPQDLVTALAWQQNPTRWCSIGNIVATMLAAQPSKVELLRYMAAMDQQGMGMVTSAGAVMW